MQRRCGTKQFWELISFTGTFDPEFLEEILPGDANQLADEEAQDKSQLKIAALEARATLRLANKYKRILAAKGKERLTQGNLELIDDLDSGTVFVDDVIRALSL